MVACRSWLGIVGRFPFPRSNPAGPQTASGSPSKHPPALTAREAVALAEQGRCKEALPVLCGAFVAAPEGPLDGRRNRLESLDCAARWPSTTSIRRSISSNCWNINFQMTPKFCS